MHIFQRVYQLSLEFFFQVKSDRTLDWIYSHNDVIQNLFPFISSTC